MNFIVNFIQTQNSLEIYIINYIGRDIKSQMHVKFLLISHFIKIASIYIKTQRHKKPQNVSDDADLGEEAALQLA